jgi:hypothetical protein
MTESRGSLRLRAASSSMLARISTPARVSPHRFSSTLVGWLIQTAVISVIRETCETYSESRGFNDGDRLGISDRAASRSRLPLNLSHRVLFSRAWSQKSKLFATGFVAGERRMRRAIPR